MLIFVLFCEDPDVSATDGFGTAPSGQAPALVNIGANIGANVGANANPGRSTSDDKPFLKTIPGIIVLVAVCVAIILVIAVIVFFVARNRREKGAYYEEFDEYDTDGAGMPNEVSRLGCNPLCVKNVQVSVAEH